MNIILLAAIGIVAIYSLTRDGELKTPIGKGRIQLDGAMAARLCHESCWQ